MDDASLIPHLKLPLFMNMLKRIVEAPGFDGDILRNFKTLITLSNLDFSQSWLILNLEYIWDGVNSFMCKKSRNSKIKTISSVKQCLVRTSWACKNSSWSGSSQTNREWLSEVHCCKRIDVVKMQRLFVIYNGCS